MLGLFFPWPIVMVSLPARSIVHYLLCLLHGFSIPHDCGRPGWYLTSMEGRAKIPSPPRRHLAMSAWYAYVVLSLLIFLPCSSFFLPLLLLVTVRVWFDRLSRLHARMGLVMWRSCIWRNRSCSRREGCNRLFWFILQSLGHADKWRLPLFHPYQSLLWRWSG